MLRLVFLNIALILPRCFWFFEADSITQYDILSDADSPELTSARPAVHSGSGSGVPVGALEYIKRRGEISFFYERDIKFECQLNVTAGLETFSRCKHRRRFHFINI